MNEVVVKKPKPCKHSEIPCAPCTANRNSCIRYRSAHSEKCKAVDRARKNTDVARKARRDRWAGNVEACRARARLAYAKNHDRVRASNRAYRLRNLEADRQRCRAWHEKNRVRHSASCAKWRLQNPDKDKALHAKWRALNPEKVKSMACEKQARRRAEKAGCVVTKFEINEIVKMQAGLCYLCSTPLGSDKTIDHVVPLLSHGPHLPENVGIVHGSCNSRKGHRSLLMYLVRYGRAS